MRDLEKLQQKDQLVEGVGTTILAHVSINYNYFL